jgi:hypothetical protein
MWTGGVIFGNWILSVSGNMTGMKGGLYLTSFGEQCLWTLTGGGPLLAPHDLLFDGNISCMKKTRNSLSPTVGPRAREPSARSFSADHLDRAPCRTLSDRQRMRLKRVRHVDTFHDESAVPTLRKVS